MKRGNSQAKCGNCVRPWIFCAGPERLLVSFWWDPELMRIQIRSFIFVWIRIFLSFFIAVKKLSCFNSTCMDGVSRTACGMAESWSGCGATRYRNSLIVLELCLGVGGERTHWRRPEGHCQGPDGEESGTGGWTGRLLGAPSRIPRKLKIE